MTPARSARDKGFGVQGLAGSARLCALPTVLALALLPQPCAAGSLDGRQAQPSSREPASIAASASFSAGTSDIDRVDAGILIKASPVTFGRALDLEGSPIRLVSPRRDSLLAALPAAWTGPAATPAGSPVRATRLSSGFGSRWHPILGGGRFHAGVDLAAPAGSLVEATAPGLVQAAGWCGGYGLCVMIDHGGGYATIYGHLSKIDVAAGQAVSSGQAIGSVGSTGLSTGPHLHYEVRFRERPVNPRKFL